VDLISSLDTAPGMDKDHYVFIRADRAVPYGELMGVMELLRQGGYNKVKLVALEGVAPAPAIGQPADATKP
jgi:biopolymer transport protein ExbD